MLSPGVEMIFWTILRRHYIRTLDRTSIMNPDSDVE